MHPTLHWASQQWIVLQDWSIAYIALPLHKLQARAGALEEFGSIMADSASSMTADVPLLTPADKTDWWRKRLELDQRMARLLQHLDCEWLGPWKYAEGFLTLKACLAYLATQCHVHALSPYTHCGDMCFCTDFL